jgi:hypothetical protein
VGTRVIRLVYAGNLVFRAGRLSGRGVGHCILRVGQIHRILRIPAGPIRANRYFGPFRWYRRHDARDCWRARKGSVSIPENNSSVRGRGPGSVLRAFTLEARKGPVAASIPENNCSVRGRGPGSVLRAFTLEARKGPVAALHS